ncbi:Hypp2280 [Branchiostoma lanceolatum]|uniref:Hypp2280 protein n=1 Tax=Branchiostoma lanceolatum TaxID=7740 RepID=A0A8J9ZS99_BRALA|nr:Hypp2280 [Branchiostoma lanceolatum]
MRAAVTFLALLCVLRDVYSAPAGQGEKQLINQLGEKLKFSENEEEVVEELINDEKGKTDNENNNLQFRMQVDQIVEKLKVLNDDEIQKVRHLFNKKLGGVATDKIFLEAHRIYQDEQDAFRELEEDLWLDKEEDEAFERLVKDLETGNDPYKEDNKTLYGIGQFASSVTALPKDEQELVRGLIMNRYGEDLGKRLLGKMAEINNHVNDLLETDWEYPDEVLDSDEEDVGEGKRFWKNLGLEVPDALLVEDPWATDDPDLDEAWKEEEEKEEEDAEQTKRFWKKLGIGAPGERR